MARQPRSRSLGARGEVVAGIDIAADQALVRRGEELKEKRDRLMARRAAQSAVYFWDKPDLFVRKCIRWDEDDEGPTAYQEENLRMLVEFGRLGVRGPHGLGKTATNAWAVLWFAVTREAAEVDWKVITTASAWRQLTKYLWPEIKKWARKLDWKRIGRDPFTAKELLTMNLKLEFGEAFAVACEDPATIEGAHADQMFYIYDEAKTIPEATFNASEGAFSGAGAETKNEAFALASSTPGEPQGRFYEIHARKPGLESWKVVHVTKGQAEAAKRIGREWAEEMGRLWGEDSAIYKNRVLGEFAEMEEDGVIPLRWVEEAVHRWEMLEKSGWPELGPFTSCGIDIARKGGDQTIYAKRHGNVVRDLERLPRADTMETTGYLAMKLRQEFPPRIVMDVMGVGAGVYDRMREQGFQVTGFNASAKSDMWDRSRSFGFVNQRSAGWWNLRDMLRPDSGEDIALPPDDEMIGDLVAPKWKPTSGGKVQVESKDDIFKRIGRSTDRGDAIVMAFYTDTIGSISAPIFSTAPSRHSLGRLI